MTSDPIRPISHYPFADCPFTEAFVVNRKRREGFFFWRKPPVGGDMVSREVVGWGLNLGLQKATGSKCRLLAGALPGKCSIDVGKLVALLKFMQEAINTFGQTMSETHIGVLVYTIDSMGQGTGRHRV